MDLDKAYTYLSTSMLNLSIAAGLVVLCALLYWAVSGVYYAYFHPLAKFPGPKLAGASQLPYIVAFLRGELPYWIQRLHEDYQSEVVRITPTELSFVSPQAWADIYKRKAGRADYERSRSVYGKPPNGFHSIFDAPNEEHARMRRIFNQAFTVKAVRAHEPTIEDHGRRFIEALARREGAIWSRGVDLKEWFDWLTFDLSGVLSFSQSFNCLAEERYHPWVSTMCGNLRGIAYLGATARYPLLRSVMPYLFPPSVKKDLAKHMEYFDKALERRFASEKMDAKDDIMTPALEARKLPGGPELGELHSHMQVFVIAASDTISTVLCGITYLLLKHPACLASLRKELLSNFHGSEDITVRSVADLPYLQAVFNEALRLYPVALTAQAAIAPPSGDMVCGHWIPPSTGVCINQYVVSRWPSNFRDAASFVPERWLGDRRYDSDAREAFQPFSAGPRNCIGIQVGEAVVRLIVAKMVWNFDMDLDVGSAATDWLDQKAFFSWEKKPLKVQIRSRSGEGANL